MAEAVIYEFPWPPKELSPNARVHWRTLARVKRAYGEACGWALFYQGPRGLRLVPPVQAHITFIVTDKRRRDTDNYLSMLKPLWDELVEMGLLEDDSHDKLRILESKWERGPEKKVVVELKELRDV